MRLLLDTHAFLWWMEESHALGAAAQAAISDPENNILISIASLWELTIKRALGKLTFPADLESVLREEGFSVLPITFAHLRQLGSLPLLHRDPFDRMLIAQAQAESIPITTADGKFAPYGVTTIW
ncbi:MAG: type II toxin-antitoxin system VapC family toxin [Stellaceae bacterium]